MVTELISSPELIIISRKLKNPINKKKVTVKFIRSFSNYYLVCLLPKGKGERGEGE